MDEKHLESVPLFAGLSKQERQALAQRADEIDVREGYLLVQEGEFSYEFFVITDGTAEVTRESEHIATLGPGDFFGEVGILSTDRRTANVTATSPMNLIVLTAQAFRILDRDTPSVCAQIREAIEQRFAAEDAER